MPKTEESLLKGCWELPLRRLNPTKYGDLNPAGVTFYLQEPSNIPLSIPHPSNDDICFHLGSGYVGGFLDYHLKRSTGLWLHRRVTNVDSAPVSVTISAAWPGKGFQRWGKIAIVVLA